LVRGPRIALLIGVVVAAPMQLARGASVNWSQAEVVSVAMIDDRFVPDKLSFRHDVPYRLHLENHGKELHEFTAPAFFTQATVRDPHVLANGGQDVVVQPGGAADVFLVPRKPGRYRLICADHDWAGMIGEITVQ
jgi:uncharacterized cupredoxin-like copper-binding protein